MPVVQQRPECHAGERKQLDLLDVENLAQRHPIVTMRGERHILVIQVIGATKSLSTITIDFKSRSMPGL